MKLESIKTFVVGNPPPSFGGRYFVFVKIRTACGIEGVGEAYAATFSPHVIAAMAVDLFERVFAGEDPMQTETLWRRAYGEGFSLRPDISLMGVLSALEMACWDITGKALNRPIYSLLGGLVNPRLRSYTYLYPDENEDASFYGDPVRSAERAAVYVKQGFTAIKFDPVGGYSVFDPRQPTLERMDMSERFCKLIREAVGDKADILFGTHGQYTVSGAKRLARRLEKYDPLWFEEPTPPERPEMMAEVARHTCIPIATGGLPWRWRASLWVARLGLPWRWRASRQAVPGGGSQRRGRALNAPTDLRCSPPGRTEELAARPAGATLRQPR
jgi:galactonate dehydratase